MPTFKLLKHTVLAPGIVSEEDRRSWACGALPEFPQSLPDVPLTYKKRLPMMKARRMSLGSRLACEAALEVASDFSVEAWIFSSRHGETGRGVKIVDALTVGETASPTDFVMSVHNAAAGMFSIENQCNLPVTSLAAGAETFHMAVLEAAALLGTGMNQVAVVDFESEIPEELMSAFECPSVNMTYATAWVLAKGDDLHVTSKSGIGSSVNLPISLQLAAGLAAGRETFCTQGEKTQFCWERRL